MASQGTIVFRCDGMNLKAAPGTLFVLAEGTLGLYAGLRFIPQFCYMHLRALSGGALTTGPRMRVGTNANHDNVCPIFTGPLGLLLNQIGSVPLAAPILAPPIDTTDLVFEITQSAVGPAIMAADILLAGLLVG